MDSRDPIDSSLEQKEEAENFLLQADEDMIFDPISKERIRFPVSATDGYTYELHTLCVWFNKGHITSPMTGQPLKGVVYNRQLKSMLDKTYGTDRECYSAEVYRNEKGDIDIQPFLDFLSSKLNVEKPSTPTHDTMNIARRSQWNNHHQDPWKDAKEIAAFPVIVGLATYGVCFSFQLLYTYANTFLSGENESADDEEYIAFLASLGVTFAEFAIRATTKNQYSTASLLYALPEKMGVAAEKTSDYFSFFTTRAANYIPFFSAQTIPDVEPPEHNDTEEEENENRYRR